MSKSSLIGLDEDDLKAVSQFDVEWRETVSALGTRIARWAFFEGHSYFGNTDKAQTPIAHAVGFLSQMLRESIASELDRIFEFHPKLPDSGLVSLLEQSATVLGELRTLAESRGDVSECPEARDLEARIRAALGQDVSEPVSARGR